MKRLPLILLLIAAAAPCGAQFLNFGGRGMGAGRGRSQMVFRTPNATGRFRPNMWLDFTTRRCFRAGAPYNWRTDRLDYGNLWLTPNWDWQQRRYEQEQVDFNFDDGPSRPAAETGWRKYMRQ